jgi:hypothetical protein
MSHDELKNLLNDKFGQMYQILTSGGDVLEAQQMLEELTLQIEGLI